MSGLAIQVNDGAVTSTDVIAPIRPQLLELVAHNNRKSFVNQAAPLIARSTADEVRALLVYQYAYEKMSSDEYFEDALNAQMEKKRRALLAQYDGSVARAQQELAGQGLTFDDLLDDARRAVVVSAYQELNFLPTLDITRNQLLQYYQTRLREEYTTKASIQFQLIDIQADKFLPEGVASGDETQRAQAREKAHQAAKDALEKLRNGAEFSAVVAQYSHGFRRSYEGVWRPIEPAALQPRYLPVAKALESIEPGQTTEIIEGQNCFFIARLLERQETAVMPFAQVQDQIEAALQNQRWQEFSARLSNDLFAKAIIGDLNIFVEQVAATAWDQLSPAATAAAGNSSPKPQEAP